MKKLLTMLLATAMMLTLAACGPTPNETGNDTLPVTESSTWSCPSALSPVQILMSRYCRWMTSASKHSSPDT